MGKIKDALRKIQDEGTEQADKAPRTHRKIGRIESNNVDGAELHDDMANNPSMAQQASRIIRIDKDAMRDAGLIAPEAEAGLFEDEYRVIKRPILSNAFGRNAAAVEHGHNVLISSALSGDGKTFTCINLALSLAREQDTSVLLIDADVRKPHISSLFDAQSEHGLVDYLDGSISDLRDIELQTSINGLTFLPAGKSRENVTELLSGDRVQELFDSVHRRDPRRVILMDSSPLLQTTESRVLATAAGQVVLVVRAGITPKDAVLEAVSALDKDKPTNLILNQVRFSSGSNYYHGYHGGYGSAYGDSDDAKK